MDKKRHKITALLSLVGLMLTVFQLSSCAPYQSRHQSVQVAVNKYKYYVKEGLQSDFHHAHVSYPPQQMVLIAYKRTRRLQLWVKSKRSVWRYIKTFPILAASGGPGPKLHNHDHQVPEGIYHIVEFNPYSHFHLSMELNYPNRFDRYHALLDGRVDLGNQIFIHGSHYSAGCIAVGNSAIEQLFVLSYIVGLDHIKVIVAPDDLRYYKPVYGRVHPHWLPKLYRDIRHALAPFKGHA